MDEPAEYVGPLLEGYRRALDAATDPAAAAGRQQAQELWRWMQVRDACLCQTRRGDWVVWTLFGPCRGPLSCLAVRSLSRRELLIS